MSYWSQTSLANHTLPKVQTEDNMPLGLCTRMLEEKKKDVQQVRFPSETAFHDYIQKSALLKFLKVTEQKRGLAKQVVKKHITFKLSFNVASGKK